MERTQNKNKTTLWSRISKLWSWISNRLISFIFFVFFLGLGGYATLMIYLDKSTNATILYGVAFLCLIFCLLEKFESFEGFGIKAKLKAVDDKIEEADEMLKLLKDLTRNAIYITSRMGRGNSIIPRRERYEFMSEVEQSLKNMKIPPKDIEFMKKYWHQNNLFDLAEKIIFAIQNAYHDEVKIETTKNVALNDKLALAKQEAGDFSVIYRGSLWNLHEDLKKFIQNSKTFDDTIKQKWLQDFHEDLLDIEHYTIHKDFRRKEHFFAKDDHLIL
ncbi:MAG: hypothetical protein AB1454_12305 [Candidatus Auribacterota bacterium]